MTYKEIIEALHDRVLISTAASLDYAVHDEACKLIEFDRQWGKYKNRKLRIPDKKAVEAAQDFYAEDITEQLREHRALTPQLLLSNRRVGIAWAVAEILRSHAK